MKLEVEILENGKVIIQTPKINRCSDFVYIGTELGSTITAVETKFENDLHDMCRVIENAVRKYA